MVILGSGVPAFCSSISNTRPGNQTPSSGVNVTNAETTSERGQVTVVSLIHLLLSQFVGWALRESVEIGEDANEFFIARPDHKRRERVGGALAFEAEDGFAKSVAISNVTITFVTRTTPRILVVKQLGPFLTK